MSTVKRTTTIKRGKKGKTANAPASTTTTTIVQKQPTAKKMPRPVRRGNKAKMLAGSAGLSACASDYARALANPFTGPLACVPSFPAFLTRRARVYCKGVLTTSSTNSFGYILAEPTNMVANDIDAVSVSTAASAVTAAQNTVAGDAAIALFRTNSEYTQAQFGTGAGLLQYRVVAMGIRVRYIGTNLNEGGILIGLHEPDHDTLVGSGITQFDAQVESRRMIVGKRWTTVLYKPVNSVDANLRPNFALASTNTAWYMGFVIQSAVTAQNFEFEVYAIHELEGRTLRGKTPSHSDPVGYSSVSSVAATSAELYPTTRSDEERERSMIEQTLDYMNEAISQPIAAAKIASAAGSAGFAAGQYVNHRRHNMYND